MNGINGSEAPKLTRGISESERSSSPEKPEQQRTRVIEGAKRFRRYYQRYKEEHDKMALTAECDRKDSDVAALWKMHQRVKEMKEEIWNSWDKVEHQG